MRVSTRARFAVTARGRRRESMPELRIENLFVVMNAFISGILAASFGLPRSGHTRLFYRRITAAVLLFLGLTLGGARAQTVLQARISSRPSRASTAGVSRTQMQPTYAVICVIVMSGKQSLIPVEAARPRPGRHSDLSFVSRTAPDQLITGSSEARHR